MSVMRLDLRPYTPQISLKERDRRWQAVRNQMEAQGLDCLVVWGNTISQGLGMINVRYLTQIGSQHGGIALFPREGEVTIFNCPPHMNRPHSPYLAAQDWVQDIRPFSLNGVIAEIKARGFERGKLGMVTTGNVVAGNNLTYHDYVAFTSALPEASIVDVSRIIETLRRVKSAEEIALLGESGRIARLAVEAMIETAGPGVGEHEVYAAMIHKQIVEGGEPNLFNLMASGPAAAEGLEVRLLHGGDQPLCPVRRPLQKGDLIICEFHVGYAGYLSGVEFTVCVGAPPPEIRELHAVAVECLRGAEEYCRPGVTLGELTAAIRNPVTSRDLDYVELGFHNHGLSSADYPTIVYKPGPGKGKISGEGMKPFTLEENMVLGTNIDIHNPRWRTDVGVMLGDTLQVTPQGGRRLVGIPLELPVK